MPTMKRYLLTILLFLFSATAFAQIGCIPGEEDGPVDPTKSAVKKVGETVTVSWTLPEFLTDCTPLADDPTYALTSVELFIAINRPADTSFAPVVLPPTQTSIDVTVQSGATGTATGEKTKRVYYAVRSCNEYGCGPLSGQPWVLVGGPPGRNSATAQ